MSSAVEPLSLRITEIFLSLQGETNLVGLPTVFVRLTGCPLRCHYCDSAYAFKGGTIMTLQAIQDKVAEYGVPRVTVTGGEPLAQQNVLPLLKNFCDEKYQVSLETSGAMSVAQVDERVIKILDIKTPASGEVSRNDMSNLAHLQAHDQIKFVICDEADYEWAKQCLTTYDFGQREILFSPSHEQLSPASLAAWICKDALAVRMQLQIHKYIWGDIPGV